MSAAAATTIISTLRHARTAYAEQKRYAGSLDVPLSEQGISDCRSLAGAIDEAEYDVVITSNLRRSADTARLLGLPAAKTISSDLCRERGFGVMEGLTADDVRALEPPVLFIEVADDTHSVNPSGGEALEDVWQRAKRFSRFVLAHYAGSRVLVVSHGVFLQMYHGVLRGSNCIESLAYYPSTLQLTRFELCGRRLVAEEQAKLADALDANF